METALSDRDVQAALKQRLDMINTQLDRYEKIRKITVISDDFPEELRSPTALQKIKIDRQAVKIDIELRSRPFTPAAVKNQKHLR